MELRELDLTPRETQHLWPWLLHEASIATRLSPDEAQLWNLHVPNIVSTLEQDPKTLEIYCISEQFRNKCQKNYRTILIPDLFFTGIRFLGPPIPLLSRLQVRLQQLLQRLGDR